MDASSANFPEAFSTGRDTVAEYDPETDAPFTESPASSKNDQVDVAGQTILGLLHKAASAAEAKSRYAIETDRNCQNSFVPQKIGSLNWKLRTSFIAKGRSVPKNGFAEFPRKSKVGLSESHEATGRSPVGNGLNDA